MIAERNSSFKELFKDSKLIRIPKSQVVIQAGETPRGVFYIVSGFVKTYNISHEGDYQIIALSGSGEVFPLYWSLDSLPRNIFFESLTSLEVKVLQKEDFQSMVFNDPHYMKVAIDTLLASYNAMQDRIHNLEYRSARERVIYRLAYLGSHFGKTKGKNIEIIVPVTYQDIADSLNLTRDTVNRVMLELIEEKLVNRKSKSLTLKNMSKFKEIIDIE